MSGKKSYEQPFTETWSPERRREKAIEILSGEYITFCAFDGDTVVGEIMLIPELNENRLILGCSVSGKSTFARKLQELVGHPLVHFDNIWWKESRKQKLS